MAKATKKSKRVYTKKAAHSIPVITVEADKELAQLGLMCQVIESWDDDQKRRNLDFIVSKYDLYINTSKIR